jgi:molybdopterin-guanine dinucleotide biosynthesis protein B
MEGLINELSKRGYRVATIKHSHHTVELDQRGKDTWRHQQAGATLSIISSPGAVAVFGKADRELTVEELCTMFIHDVDLILAEGYKGSNYPKIVVVDNEKVDMAGWVEVKAIVSHQPLDISVPVFRPTDVMGIVKFLIDKFLGRRDKKTAGGL